MRPLQLPSQPVLFPCLSFPIRSGTLNYSLQGSTRAERWHWKLKLANHGSCFLCLINTAPGMVQDLPPHVLISAGLSFSVDTPAH